ncbi:ammonium transporter [Endozoicomonas arenosclerae]|uniref:ammonium transporter n=1 Tax=Endozoicomonas arenosclerae TaxID=1633495 RepID=UPI0007806FF3|nr:ammonium transporter [Endozoicomonas arenosclerae]
MPYGHLNTLFLTLCILLVFMMQIGFLCLEAGAVRSKNNVNVAAKNLLDFVLVTLVYALISFSIQFGAFDALLERAHPRSPGYPYLFLMFQALFAVTATTIVSGAIAERSSLKAYLVIALLVALVIYPIAGQWIWGGILGTPEGWLHEMGFIDFAGATLVHVLGGSVALAAILIIGPRDGFGEESYKKFRGQNQVITLMGAMLIWLGWFGFNMGSLLKVDVSMPTIMTTTMLGACSGGLAATVWSLIFFKKFDVPVIANGVLAGLVGITAGAHILEIYTSIIIGFIAGLICCGAMAQLEHWKIDDVIGAVPVHMAAGIWGTVAVALLGNLREVNNGLNTIEQLGVQAMGVAVTVAWAFGISYCTLFVINKFIPLRVTREAEQLGLNIAEHGSTTELSDLAHKLEKQAEQGHFKPVIHEPFSELGGITRQYNRVLERFLETQNRLNLNIKTLQNIRDQLQMQRDKAESANRHKSIFLTKMSHEIRTPLIGIIATSDLMKDENLTEDQAQYVEIIQQSGQALMDIVTDVLDYSRIESGKLELERQPFDLTTLFEQSKSVFIPETLSRPIELDIKIELGTPVDLMGDVNRLRQVMVNLIGNAFKFTDSGTVMVNASTVAETDSLLIEVIDTGPGIPEEKLNSIFESFEQADNTHSRQFGGSGLGLTLSKHLVELMGGSLSVASEKDKGSTFTIKLPIVRQETQKSA